MLLKKTFPGIAWGVLIGFLCAVPGDGMPDLPYWKFFPFDKFAHGVAFFILSYLLATGFKKQREHLTIRRHGIKFAFGVSITYGCLLELLQLFIFAGRSAEVLDVVANSTGSILGLILFYTIFNKSIVVG